MTTTNTERCRESLTNGFIQLYQRNANYNTSELLGPLLIKGIHHTGFSIPDLKQAIDFYTRFGGFELVHQFSIPDTKDNRRLLGVPNPAAKVAWLRGRTAYLELLQFETNQGIKTEPRAVTSATDYGLTHCCFEVEDVTAKVTELKALGIRFLSDPLVAETNSVVFGKDPAGNLFELMSLKGSAKAFSLDQLSRSPRPTTPGDTR